MPHRLHLNKDKKLAKIMSGQQVHVLQKRKHLHLHLCASIISQQLSTRVADVIYGRFIALFSKKNPSAADITAIPFEALRGIGLSNAKANYVHNVCLFFMEQKLTDARLHRMDDEAIVQLLIQIKGVGRWTVEMLLMFSLGREDVFAVDDLGIQQSMAKLYGIDSSDKKAMKEKMQQLAGKWSPYRTYACRYLWGWKDGK